MSRRKRKAQAVTAPQPQVKREPPVFDYPTESLIPYSQLDDETKAKLQQPTPFKAEGEAIYAIRSRLGISIGGFSSMLRISPVEYCDIESGRKLASDVLKD